MSIRKPTLRRPKSPKIKKTLTSKRKRIIKKLPTISRSKVKTTIPSTKLSTHKKTHSKTPMGTCYLEKNCNGVLARKLTKTQCRDQGGKSWKKAGGLCEKL